jgi:hypothetical protein
MVSDRLSDGKRNLAPERALVLFVVTDRGLFEHFGALGVQFL